MKGSNARRNIGHRCSTVPYIGEVGKIETDQGPGTGDQGPWTGGGVGSWGKDFSLGQPKPRCERINRSYKVEPEEVEEHYVTWLRSSLSSGYIAGSRRFSFTPTAHAHHIWPIESRGPSLPLTKPLDSYHSCPRDTFPAKKKESLRTTPLPLPPSTPSCRFSPPLECVFSRGNLINSIQTPFLRTELESRGIHWIHRMATHGSRANGLADEKCCLAEYIFFVFNLTVSVTERWILFPNKWKRSSVFFFNVTFFVFYFVFSIFFVFRHAVILGCIGLLHGY